MYAPNTFQNVASVLGFRESEFLHIPFKSGVSVSYSLSAVMDVNPNGFQSQMLWELIFPVQIPWPGKSDMGFKSLSPQGKPSRL